MTPRRVSWAALALAAVLALDTARANAIVPTPEDRQAQAGCASAEACLASAFERDWAQYYDLIEKTWASRQRVAGLIQRAEAVGRHDLVTQLRAEQAKIEERWRFADGVARALTAPHFREFLVRRQAAAARAHAGASRRAQKETDFYRRLVSGAIGPARDGVIRDIEGYEREGRELRKTFERDTLMTGLSFVKEGVGAAAKQWKDLAALLTKNKVTDADAIITGAGYAEAFSAVVTAGYAGAEAVHAGMSVDAAIRQHQNLLAMVEGARSLATGTLRMAELLALAPKSPLTMTAMRQSIRGAALRASLYTNVLAVGLDTGLTVAAVDRLKAAEARQTRVETSDAHWRARADAAARSARDAAVRETRAATQVANQRRVDALYARILQEGGR